MGNTVRSNNNFFRCVNGTWLDRTEIPDDRTSWRAFEIVFPVAILQPPFYII
jgi:predicted metalloendopeptidase